MTRKKEGRALETNENECEKKPDKIKHGELQTMDKNSDVFPALIRLCYYLHLSKLRRKKNE